MDEHKYRFIFSQKLAGLLMYKGFVLKDFRKDKANPKKNLFVFNESQALRDVLSSYDKGGSLNVTNN